jgi:hypothetical protein
VFNLLNRQDTYLGYRTPSVSNASQVDSNPTAPTQQQNWIGSARMIQIGARFAF